MLLNKIKKVNTVMLSTIWQREKYECLNENGNIMFLNKIDKVINIDIREKYLIF